MVVETVMGVGMAGAMEGEVVEEGAVEVKVAREVELMV